MAIPKKIPGTLLGSSKKKPSDIYQRETYNEATRGEYHGGWGKGAKVVSDRDKQITQSGTLEEAQAYLDEANQILAQNPNDPTAQQRAANARTAYDSVSSRVAYEDSQAQGAATNKANADYGLAGRVTDDQYRVDPTLMGESARGGVQADQGAMDAQTRAMNELFGIYDQGGATAQERARMARTRADQDSYLRGQRESHQQDLAERGMSGSGSEIAMMLGDRQAAGQRMASQDLETEAMLQDRALQTLLEGNKAAGNVRTSSFNEGMERGTAKDEFAAINNQILNNAASNNVDWLRQSKADLEGKKYDSWQKDIDRKVGVAGDLIGHDANQDAAGWASGEARAADKAAATNRATERAQDNYRGMYGDDAGDTYAIQQNTNAAKAGADAGAAGVLPGTVEGGGKVAEGATSAAAGASSASAFYDEDEDDEDD